MATVNEQMQSASISHQLDLQQYSNAEVRKIMALHGGSVDLVSTVGEGTVVTATFPRSRFVEPGPSSEMRWRAG